MSNAVPNPLPVSDEVLATIRDRGVAEVLQELHDRMPELFLAIARRIHIAEVLAQSGSIADITIDKIVLGTADIGAVRLNNTNVMLRAGSAVLEGVSIALELQLKVDWWYDIVIYSDHGTWNLGSMWFGLDMGTVTIPSLSNMQFNIPAVTLSNMRAQLAPIQTLQLGGAAFSGLKVSNTLLPSAGFSLEGMAFGKATIDTVGMPATNTTEVRMDHFKPGQPVALPAATLSGVAIPSTAVPAVRSGAMNVPAQAPEKSVTADAKVVGMKFRVLPIAHMHVNAMQMGNLALSANVDKVVVENVRIPVDVSGITLKQLALQNVAANQIDT